MFYIYYVFLTIAPFVAFIFYKTKKQAIWLFSCLFILLFASFNVVFTKNFDDGGKLWKTYLLMYLALFINTLTNSSKIVKILIMFLILYTFIMKEVLFY